MVSQGPNSPSTAASIANGTVIVWANPNNSLASDNSYSTVANSGSDSEYLRVTNFGFSIPSGSTINGVVVEIEQKGSAAFSVSDGINSLTLNSHKLIKSGSPVGTSKRTNTMWSATDGYVTYGSSSDLWGTTWTIAEINDSSFGFQGSAHMYGKSLVTASIDHIRITVHYTAGAASNLLLASSRTYQPIVAQ